MHHQEEKRSEAMPPPYSSISPDDNIQVSQANANVHLLLTNFTQKPKPTSDDIVSFYCFILHLASLAIDYSPVVG